MSLTAEVYQRLRADIRDLKFGSNEFLNEEALAKRYAVSKTPVRHALQRLCMEGLLVSCPRKGYLLAGVSRQELDHVRHLRLLAEGYAIELAAGNAEPESLNTLQELAEAPYSLAVNTRFHRQLAALTGSRSIADVVERLLSAAERPLSLQNMVNRPDDHRDEHLRIATALRTGDAEAAKGALAEDLSL